MKKGRWWLKENKFKRVRYLTLCRLGLLFSAEVAAGREENRVDRFLIWLEDYLEGE